MPTLSPCNLELLFYCAVVVLLPQVGDPGDDSCQPVDKLMNRGLQRGRSIVFCSQLDIVCYSLGQSERETKGDLGDKSCQHAD